MKQSYLTIIMFAGVFTVAYAGYGYQEYMARQNHAAQQTSRTQVATPQPQIQTMTRAQVSQNSSSSGYEEILDSSSPDDAASRQANASHNTTLINHASNLDDPSSTTGTMASIVPNTAYSSTTARGGSGLIFTTGISRTAVTSPSVNTSISAESSDTGTDSSLTPAGTTTVSAEIEDDEPIVAETATPIEEDDDLRMATADCLYRLPEGSTEDDALGMTETYGCRYRWSCINKNDGTGIYNCRWEYIRF